MTLEQVENLLKEYPLYWLTVQDRREQIINRYTPSCSRERISGGLTYSDPTARAAVNLLELSNIAQIVNTVGEWIDLQLIPDDRLLLLSIWRGLSKEALANRCRQEVWFCEIKWKRMTISLMNYLKASVGHVFGADGIAFARCLRKSLPEQQFS